jgi:hypothetical protein
MLESRQTTVKAPQWFRYLKRLMTRPVARDPDHQRPDHGARTRNQSFWVGNGVAPPAAERRWIGSWDFILRFNALRINPNTERPVSYDHCLA